MCECDIIEKAYVGVSSEEDKLEMMDKIKSLIDELDARFGSGFHKKFNLFQYDYVMDSWTLNKEAMDALDGLLFKSKTDGFKDVEREIVRICHDFSKSNEEARKYVEDFCRLEQLPEKPKREGDDVRNVVTAMFNRDENELTLSLIRENYMSIPWYKRPFMWVSDLFINLFLDSYICIMRNGKPIFMRDYWKVRLPDTAEEVRKLREEAERKAKERICGKEDAEESEKNGK